MEAILIHPDFPTHTLARCFLKPGLYRIGHLPTNEIVVDHPSVSALHAHLTIGQDGEIFLEDLSSSNGSTVNGTPTRGLTPVTLECQVLLGSVSLSFQNRGIPAAVFQYLPDDFLSSPRYLLGNLIVQGSTSTIYEAHDRSLNRTVAMKILLPITQSNPTAILHFIRESHITAQLQHPGILPIFDLDLSPPPQKSLFSTTRFVEGLSLAQLVDSIHSPTSSSTPPSLSFLLVIWQKVADTIAYAHSRGVIHGKIRPEIITVGRFGEVFVNDWNLAKIIPLPHPQYPAIQAPNTLSVPPLSPYSSPEQAEADPDAIHQKTDIHALGGLLFLILTTTHPIAASTESQLLEKILSPRPSPAQALEHSAPPPHWPSKTLPPSLAAITERALSLNPHDRHDSVQDLQKEVADYQISTPSSSKSWSLTNPFSRH